MPSPIEKHFGMERIKARAPEWLAAMSAGKCRAPKCTATTKIGNPCRNEPLRGAALCRHHLKGKARTEYDRIRLPHWQRQAQKANERSRTKANQSLNRIDRRELHRAWLADPQLPGSTLHLTPNDESRVRNWLFEQYGIDIDDISPNGEQWTSRAVDRLRWTGYLALSGKLTQNKAKYRLISAMRDDAIFYNKIKECNRKINVVF